MPTKKLTSSTPVTSTHHKDKRVNIPTKELEGFMSEEEQQPKTILYPRDPSLDPQLVWQGKDEQDQHALEVPAVPVYIQEKIHPQAIIDNVRSQAKEAQPDAQLSLFSDFNNIAFEDLVDFYHHEQNWTNRMVLGDSLLVMTSLAEKEGLKGKVQMIYIDPPYGIKFGSNWQVSTRKRDVRDGKDEDVTRQPEQIKAFRDTWEMGIHSYLAYLQDRLTVAHELLTESGSVFVQIGEENVHLVRCLLDEVFGSENYVGQVTFNKTSGAGSPAIGTLVLASVTDYVIWYAKSIGNIKYRQLYSEKDDSFDPGGKYSSLELETGKRLPLNSSVQPDGLLPKGSRIFRLDNLTSQSSPPVPFQFNGKSFVGGWKTNNQGLQRLTKANRIDASKNSLNYVRYANDFAVYPLNNIWTDVGGIQSRIDPKVYVVQTNTKVIERCMLMVTDPGDLVLDPTCGSGTTAYVAEQWGRRWITIDTSRVAIALARTRLIAGRFPYYLLADSPDGIQKEMELSAQLPPTPLPATNQDIRRGFVYKRVPHITLKSIANNEEIDAIHKKHQYMIDKCRIDLNLRLGTQWEEWEIPREAGKDWRGGALEAHEVFWKTRRERQKEIDASIAKNADTELLYDQPYEDGKKVRVTGPFTVESLSPHRVLAMGEEATAKEQAPQDGGNFETMILDNLRAAGVQNTKKGERLKFDRLESYAGTWLHATGEYNDADGKARQAAVCIGPEHGTVGTELVQDAAIEAVKGIGFDLLLVCGFAFDPHVSEETKRYGKLMVLPVRMNPDLAMGDTLLKKTGAGNLFMVFGEPDIEIQKCGDGKIAVKLNGVDVYDPTTGEIRSSSTDDIACWFIDTDYDERSFFVRQAYFTGADEPYEKLKRALRAEIDEDAWSRLYSTVSMPFEKPKRGLIAVKVINHYGDEVLKVYGLN